MKLKNKKNKGIFLFVCVEISPVFFSFNELNLKIIIKSCDLHIFFITLAGRVPPYSYTNGHGKRKVLCLFLKQKKVYVASLSELYCHRASGFSIYKLLETINFSFGKKGFVRLTLSGASKLSHEKCNL